jgi:hypothetical protein
LGGVGAGVIIIDASVLAFSAKKRINKLSVVVKDFRHRQGELLKQIALLRDGEPVQQLADIEAKLDEKRLEFSKLENSLRKHSELLQSNREAQEIKIANLENKIALKQSKLERMKNLVVKDSPLETHTFKRLR